MSDNSGVSLAISMGFLAVVISLTLINWNIQSQTDAINNSNPNYVSNSIQHSISESISRSISSQQQNVYCNSISQQANNGNTSAVILNIFGSSCPDSFMNYIPYVLFVSIAITIFGYIVNKLHRGY